ncbi:MAG: ATP-binding protein [Chloroflexota bacterium]
MKTDFSRNWISIDGLIALLILGVLLFFTYGLLIVAPYPGFYFDPADGRILMVRGGTDSSITLEDGDFIEQIGPLTWTEYHGNRKLNFFQGVEAGQIVPIIVRRSGERITVPWLYPGLNREAFTGRFFNVWLLAYVFWAFGVAVQLFMWPKNLRWRLLISANYLTALLIIFGSLSSLRLWMSSYLLHAVAWLILPVYLQFHWSFPAPLRETPKWAWLSLYAVCVAMALAEVFLSVPLSLYFLAVVAALGGSVILLLTHFVRKSAERSTVRILLVGSLLAVLPTIVLSLLGAFGTIPEIGPLSLFALPIMPATYFYAAYRGRLGGWELRSNRAISIYAFLILFGTALSIIVGLTGVMNLSHETFLFVSIGMAMLTAWLTILLFPAFQGFVERQLLGARLGYEDLPATYSARITTSTALADLFKLLEEEVFPTLLVKQYAFVQVGPAEPMVILSKDVTADQIRKEALEELLASFRTHSRIPLWEDGQPFEWVRLILPLQIDSDLIGVWLLGRRDPDDLYPRAELPILQSLADQTAIALSNIIQTERLRKMYNDDTERNEKSRHQLALDLHDSVLNQLAVLRLNVDEAHVSLKFEKAYEEVTTRLREIVTNLRPPMLDYGLQFALEELADNLMERSKDAVKVTANVQAKGECRYPENIERNIYRITQEACENSIRHGQAMHVNILAKLGLGGIWLLIEDDGVGFEMAGRSDLDALLAQQHFGLAGMMERAMLINAQMGIDSYPKGGTRIQISWSEAHAGQADSAKDDQ